MPTLVLLLCAFVLFIVPGCSRQDPSAVKSQNEGTAQETTPDPVATLPPSNGSPADAAASSEWSEAARREMLEKGQRQLAAGETFPFDFTVTDIQGAEIKLADLKGKVVIVDFWGTWCPPCRAEVPSFVKLQERYGAQGLQIMGLSYEHGADDAENAKTVRDFVDANKINYPCALGTEEIAAQVPDFGGFPTTVFLDRTGRVRAKLVGYHEYAMLEALTVVLLEEADTAPSTP